MEDPVREDDGDVEGASDQVPGQAWLGHVETGRNSCSPSWGELASRVYGLGNEDPRAAKEMAGSEVAVALECVLDRLPVVTGRGDGSGLWVRVGTGDEKRQPDDARKNRNAKPFQHWLLPW